MIRRELPEPGQPNSHADAAEYQRKMEARTTGAGLVCELLGEVAVQLYRNGLLLVELTETGKEKLHEQE